MVQESARLVFNLTYTQLSRGDNVIANGVPDQTTERTYPKFLGETSAVIFCRANTDHQLVCYLLVAITLGK